MKERSRKVFEQSLLIGVSRAIEQVHPVDPFHSLDNLKNHFASIAFCMNSAVHNVRNGAVIEWSFVV